MARLHRTVEVEVKAEKNWFKVSFRWEWRDGEENVGYTWTEYHVEPWCKQRPRQIALSSVRRAQRAQLKLGCEKVEPATAGH